MVLGFELKALLNQKIVLTAVALRGRVFVG